MADNIVLLFVVLYILIGVYFNWCIADTMNKIPKNSEYYNKAQEIISNLACFTGFSISIFRWPRLMRIIYFGGNNDS